MLTLLGVAVVGILCFELWRDSRKGAALKEFTREMQVFVSLNSELHRALAKGEEMKASLLPFGVRTLPELTANWNEMMRSQALSIQDEILATKQLLAEIDRMYCLWKSPLKQQQLRITALDPTLPSDERSHARYLLGELGITIGPVFSSKADLKSIPR